MTSNTLVTLPWILERDPPPFEGNDIKSPEGFFRHLYKKYTKRGDKIFDPFTGMGTSVFVAEEMKRIPFGIEAEELKYQWVAGQMENWTHLICDDAFNIQKYDLPKMDLIVTCPPYMRHTDTWNPLYGGDPKYNGYDKYLKRMRGIFTKMQPLMKKKTPLIIQLDNLWHEKSQGKNMTPLVHDIQNSLSRNFIQTDEVTILWNTPKKDYTHSQYLVFQKK